jgi:hypothetical protein
MIGKNFKKSITITQKIEAKTTPAIKPDKPEANTFPILTLNFLCSSEIKSLNSLII